MEDAPRKFFRLKPGGDVRLRSAYIINRVVTLRDSWAKIEKQAMQGIQERLAKSALLLRFQTVNATC